MKRKISIPHLGYTIYIKKKTAEYNFIAWVIHDKKNQCTLYVDTPVKAREISTLAHEIVHILQYICEDRNIDFIQEQEHVGYLMQFIMNEVLGYEYETLKTS